ncbi:hypothetical protein ABZ923_00345 [Streptomyces sp. NPDC046881]|uniref:hypothetical protein n=1 Tax=Streptomyces sp. NPDC046881 TaxID=3155374 RepID=UPI0033FA15C6
MNRPLLFLDVGGPVNHYAAKPSKRPDGYTPLRVPRVGAYPEHRGLSSRRRPLRIWLNPDQGRFLLRLGIELCWATTWDDEQSELDQTYVNAHHRGPGLLHRVNPRVALQGNDLHTLADFARSLDTPRAVG